MEKQNNLHTTLGLIALGCSLMMSAAAQPSVAFAPEGSAEWSEQVALEAARRDEPGSEVLLREVLENYPESLHAADLRLELGTLLLMHNETSAALDELNRIEPGELPADRQHLLFFRRGQALLELGRYAEARPYYVALQKSGDREYATDVAYYMAYLDYQQGQYDAALTGFSTLPFTDQYATSAPYYITQILYRQGKWGDADRQAQRLLAAGQTSTEQRCELNRIVGECALRRGDRSKALSTLSTYLAETSEAQVMPIASSAYNCGVLAAEADNTILAINALSQAATSGLTTDPATAGRAYLLLGQTYLETGRAMDARMAFERAAATEGDAEVQEAAAYNYAVMVHQTQCSPFDEEIKVFEDFLNRYPQSQYADRAGEYLTEVYLTTRNYEAALASMDRIQQPTTSLRTARQRLLYRLGVQNYVNGDLATAQDNFTEAIALGSLHTESLADSYFWRGESYYQQEQYQQAESDFRSFNTLKPATADASHLAAGYYNLGYALFKQGQYTSAITPWSEYIARPSERGTATYADALSRMGDCYYYTRNFSRAEQYYAESAAADGSQTADYALYQKAFMAGLQKKYTDKLSGLQTLISTYPQSELVDDAYLERGKTYLLLGQNDEAIKAFRQVVSQYDTKSCAPEAGLQLALVYYNSGRTPEAITAYKEVIAQHPGSTEAQTALEDLKNIYVDQGDVSTYATYLSTLDGRVPMSAGEQDSLTYVAATRLLSKGKTAEGQAAVEQYLATYPSGQYAQEANIQLARVYRNAGRREEALARYEAVAGIAGSSYTNEALQSAAELYTELGQNDRAYETWRRLATTTDETDYRRTALMGCLRTAAALNQDDAVIADFATLNADATLPAAMRQEGQLLCGKAQLRRGATVDALVNLRAAATDMRTVYGAEAKFLTAQTEFNQSQTDQAETEVMELINSGTPHQYWLARGFILLADVALSRDDTFQAKQYLLSLQSNYQGDAQIDAMIEERLAKCH